LHRESGLHGRHWLRLGEQVHVLETAGCADRTASVRKLARQELKRRPNASRENGWRSQTFAGVEGSTVAWSQSIDVSPAREDPAVLSSEWADASFRPHSCRQA
jgi:hypothetical protein